MPYAHPAGQAAARSADEEGGVQQWRMRPGCVRYGGYLRPQPMGYAMSTARRVQLRQRGYPSASPREYSRPPGVPREAACPCDAVRRDAVAVTWAASMRFWSSSDDCSSTARRRSASTAGGRTHQCATIMGHMQHTYIYMHPFYSHTHINANTNTHPYAYIYTYPSI